MLSLNRSVSHGHRHESHGVVAEDVEDCDGNHRAAWLVIYVRNGLQFKITTLSGPEALPFILEDLGAGSAFFKMFGR